MATKLVSRLLLFYLNFVLTEQIRRSLIAREACYVLCGDVIRSYRYQQGDYIRQEQLLRHAACVRLCGKVNQNVLEEDGYHHPYELDTPEEYHHNNLVWVWKRLPPWAEVYPGKPEAVRPPGDPGSDRPSPPSVGPPPTPPIGPGPAGPPPSPPVGPPASPPVGPPSKPPIGPPPNPPVGPGPVVPPPSPPGPDGGPSTPPVAPPAPPNGGVSGNVTKTPTPSGKPIVPGVSTTTASPHND